MRTASTSPRRSAFTLIELLVVMALILVIFSLGIGYVVFGQGNQKGVTGAQTLTGWLLNAKQRARRDQVPTGVRLLFAQDPNNAGNQIASQLLFVQQPPPYTAGSYYTDPNDATGKTLDFLAPADFQGASQYPGQVDTTTIQEGAPVQYGDYFTTAGSGVHRINTVAYNGGQGTYSVVLDSPAPAVAKPAAGTPGQLYSIIRGPRRLPSEDILQMPPGVVIDQNQSANLPLRTVIDPNPSGAVTFQYTEILFSPGGALVGQGTGSDKVFLFLRDPQPGPNASTPLILSVQTRTGFIGAFPVGPVGNPFQFVGDPRASGL